MATDTNRIILDALEVALDARIDALDVNEDEYAWIMDSMPQSHVFFGGGGMYDGDEDDRIAEGIMDRDVQAKIQWHTSTIRSLSGDPRVPDGFLDPEATKGYSFYMGEREAERRAGC